MSHKLVAGGNKACSASQHRHLILWNGWSHSAFVFETNAQCFFSIKYWRNWWLYAEYFHFFLTCLHSNWLKWTNWGQKRHSKVYIWNVLSVQGVTRHFFHLSVKPSIYHAQSFFSLDPENQVMQFKYQLMWGV